MTSHRHYHTFTPASRLGTVFLSLVLLTYILLEKKILPRSWWLPLSKLYFWPLLLPNFLIRMARGNYFSDVDGGVMLGSTPIVFAGHVAALHSDGVRAVVNLQAEYSGPVRAYTEHQIEQLWLPVIDHTEPSLQILIDAVAFIGHHRALKHRVLVHCKGGHGRSAAVAAAWLISAAGGGMSPEAAQRRLSSLRDVRSTLYLQSDIRAFYELQHSQ